MPGLPGVPPKAKTVKTTGKGHVHDGSQARQEAKFAVIAKNKAKDQSELGWVKIKKKWIKWPKVVILLGKRVTSTEYASDWPSKTTCMWNLKKLLPSEKLDCTTGT